MAWLQLSWNLNILEGNERGTDEASLEFFFVTIMDGNVRVDPHRTGNLFSGNIGWPGNIPTGTFSTKKVPTVRNPFLGLVVRATECDNSGASDRNADYTAIQDSIRNAVQETVDAGRIPTVEILWRAGNSVALIDNFGNDDDKIGVSARAYPNYGNEIAAAIAAEPRLPAGGTLMVDTIRPIELSFVESGANYNLFDSQIQIVTNDPEPSFP